MTKQTAKNASKQHILVGNLLKELFPYFIIEQEYPVSNINSSFKSNRERFDWVIKELTLVVEVHGEQHFKPRCFGGMELSKAKVNFRKQQDRDYKKQLAAESVGWIYISVSFNEKINSELLLARIKEAKENKVPIIMPEKKKYNWPKGKKIPSRKFNGEANGLNKKNR